MNSSVWDIVAILVLIFANGIFALSEIAVVSSRRVRLEQRAEAGDKGAQAALDIYANPNRFLSTVQVGISLVGVMSGALGGAALSDDLAALIGRIPALAPYSATLAFLLVVLLITYFSLVIGELIPKRVALNNPERIAARIAAPMRTLSRLTRPVVSLLAASTDLGLRLLGIRPSNEPPVTEEEIVGLLQQGTQVGVFEAAEQDMVESVFRLGERRIDALMTPRTEVIWLDLDESNDDIRQQVLGTHFSVFPVAQESLDNVIGVVNAKDVLAHLLKGETLDLQALASPPLFVPESMPALNALEMFKASGLQMALVIDEYGGMQGVVTPIDILEAIIGDLPPMGESADPSIVQREDGSWLLDGMLQIDELEDVIDLGDAFEDEAERRGYQTLGGFVMGQIGAIPTVGEHFEWKGYRFEVVDMDGRRVDKVMVVPPTVD